MKFQTTLINLGLLLASFWAQSQQDVQDSTTETSNLDPTVRYGKLENGFTYYIKDNDSETTELRLVVKAGSLHQNKNQLAHAHLLEHMGFEKLKHFPQGLSYFETEGRGNNATTRYYDTMYFVWIPSKDNEGVKNGLQLVRDWAQDIILETRSINVERKAVQGEARSNNPHRQWESEKIENILIGNTGLRPKSRVNRNKSMKNFNQASFFKFYEDWYRPDLQAAIIVGNVQVDSIEKQIKHLFSDLEMPNRIKDPKKFLNASIATLPQKNQIVSIRDTVHSEFRLKLFSKILNRRYVVKDRSDFKNKLLQELYEEIVRVRALRIKKEYDPPFTFFVPNYDNGALGYGQLYASMMTIEFKKDDIVYQEKKLKSGIIAWRQLHESYTLSELEDAKNQLRTQYSEDRNIQSKMLANRYNEHFVQGNTALDPAKESSIIYELLKEVDLIDITEFASDIGNLQKDSDFIFFSGDQYNKPEANVLEEWVSEAEELQLPPIKEPLLEISSLSEVIKQPQSKSNINFDESKSVLGFSTIRLENGIQLILKPAKPISDVFENRVSIRGFRPNYISTQENNNYLTATLVPDVIQFMGVGSYTKFELEKFKRDHNLKIRYETNKDVQLIDGDAPAGEIEELINLIHSYAKEPRKDTLAFDIWKENQREILQGISIRESSEFFVDKIEALWYPTVPTLDLNFLNQITMEKIMNSHHKWFSNFDDFTFVVTGDFDAETLKPILVKKLAALPTKNHFENNEFKYRFPLESMDKTIRYKNLDQVFVHLYFPIKISKEVETQVLLNLISRVLNERENTRLRNGSYAPGAWGDWVDTKNGVFAFKVYFDSELGNEEKMIDMALEEFRILREKGIDQETLDRIINDELINFNSKIETYGYFDFWADYIQDTVLHHEDPSPAILGFEAFLKHFINLDEVNAAATKYLSEENLQKFLIMPEGYYK